MRCLRKWCDNNPGHLIKVSNVVGNESYSTRAIVSSTKDPNGYLALGWYIGKCVPTLDSWEMHETVQCYGIWTENEDSPLWKVG